MPVRGKPLCRRIRKYPAVGKYEYDGTADRTANRIEPGHRQPHPEQDEAKQDMRFGAEALCVAIRVRETPATCFIWVSRSRAVFRGVVREKQPSLLPHALLRHAEWGAASDAVQRMGILARGYRRKGETSCRFHRGRPDDVRAWRLRQPLAPLLLRGRGPAAGVAPLSASPAWCA